MTPGSIDVIAGRRVPAGCAMAGRPSVSQGVVFDCDGLLVDTGGAWLAAVDSIVAEHGGRLSERARRAQLGCSAAQTAALILQDMPLPLSVLELADALTSRLAHKHLDGHVRAMPGAQALLEMLAPTRRLAIASNAPEEVVRAALRQAHLPDVFDAVIAHASPLRPKPAPDLYLEACRQIGVPPADAVALEDSALGARAAAAAGMTVIGIGDAPGLRGLTDLHASALTDACVLARLTANGTQFTMRQH